MKTKINLLFFFFPLEPLSLADWISLYFLYIYLPAEDVLRSFSEFLQRSCHQYCSPHSKPFEVKVPPLLKAPIFFGAH